MESLNRKIWGGVVAVSVPRGFCFLEEQKMKALNLKDQRFGRLVVEERLNEKSKRGVRLWLCRCDCGGSIKAEAGPLRDGDRRSCGCAKDKHGDHKSRLYQIWCDMKTRCLCKTNSEYNRYGGRGITVCEEWLRYPKFKEWAMANEYSDDLTIDREDNDGCYHPGNCRWVTVKKNNRNRSSVKLSPQEVGEIKHLLLNKNMKIGDVAKKYNMSRTLISNIKNSKRWEDICINIKGEANEIKETSARI